MEDKAPRKLDRRSFLKLGVGVAGATALAGCSQAPAPTPAPAAPSGGAPAAPAAPASGATAAAPAAAPAVIKKGGTLVYATSQDFTPLVPATSTGHVTFRFLSFMHEGLVREDIHDTKSPSLKTVPWLAESWTISPDGLQYTFKLRQGVKFHDGTPFDADAVKANYDRCTDPNSPYFDKTAKDLTAQIFDFVAKGEAVDKYTWRYTLKSPMGEFIRLMCDRLLILSSPAVLAKYKGDELAAHPVGTGPFKFVQRVPGQKVVLEKNPDYWGGAPALDQVIASVIIDPQARVAALQSGEIDILLEMLPDQFALLAKDPKITATFQPIPHTWFWMFNYREGPTANKLVRQAISYAWNRDAMAKDLLKGLAQPAISPAPPNNPASPPSHAPYTYDPAKAKDLLKQAGYPDGFETTLMFPQSTGGGQMQSQAMNELIQADLKKIGINLKFDMMEQTAFLTKARQGVPPTHGALQTNWTTNAQLGFWLEQMFSSKLMPPNGNNRGWYKSDEADKLMADARPVSDPAKSADAYRKVLDQIVEDAPWLWVVHDKNPVAYLNRVKGLDFASTPYLDFQPVWIDK